MGILGFILGIFIPRFTAAFLFFFTHWFSGAFKTTFWPVLGLIFMPRTMLWYSAVSNWYEFHWGFWQWSVLIIAIIADLDSGNSGVSGRPRGYL